MSDRTLRIFTAGFETETNTFSPIPTGWASFERNLIVRFTEGPVPPVGHTGPMLAWRAAAQRDGHTLIEGFSASAEPAGRVLQPVYEQLRDELLDDLRAALPVDVVLLNMHGAMAATLEDDCEGDILRRAREIAGPQAVIGAELDLHCHITERMVANATALVTFKEYPHDDIIATAEQLYALCIDAALGRTKPVMALHDCRIIGVWPTTREPIRTFVEKMRAQESGGILSISLGHGFPWGDVADVGAKVLVIADGDAERAATCAAEFGREFWEMREAARFPALSLDAGIDAALAAPPGPVVLADGADNAGGGAPSDSTFVLRRLLERGIRNAASGLYYDPMSVAVCFEAGVGTSVDLRIGGKLGSSSGPPLDVHALIRGLREAHEQDGLVGTPSLGRSAWIEVDGIDIVLVSVRMQTFAPNAFTGLGIELANKRIIVVKSTQHFYRKFAAVAPTILYLSAPGALQFDTATVSYTKHDGRFWPRLADPFSA